MQSGILSVSSTSIIGCICFQLFSYKHSQFEIIELMRCEDNSPDINDNIIRAVDETNKTITSYV